MPPFDYYPQTMPSGLAVPDPVQIITDAMARGRQGVADERDRQVGAVVEAALAQVQRQAPGIYRPIIAEFQRAVQSTSQAVIRDALTQGATALLAVAPWVGEQVTAAARQGGAAAAQGGLAAFATEAAPYAVAALIVAVAAYGASQAWGKSK